MVNRKPEAVISRWILARCAAAGDRLFARADARARAHGWQVLATHGGLGRRYRDPRIAQLARARAHAARATGTETHTRLEWVAGAGRATPVADAARAVPVVYVDGDHEVSAEQPTVSGYER